MTEPVWLACSAVVAVHDMMIARFGGSEGLRDEGLLDSALARPQNLYHHENCRDLPRLATAYAAGLIQNHPFVDGNKWSGFIAAYMFLDLNGATLRADEVTATSMTRSLAASELGELAYAQWISENISQ
jgi:death-on-curing protein